MDNVSFSLDQNSQTRAFGFGGNQDSADFCGHRVQHGEKWFPGKFSNLADRYVKGEVEIVLKGTSWADASEYDFVFFSVPLRDDNTSVGNKARTYSRKTWAEECGSEQFMLACITQSIQGPNGIIPSFVRIERAKQVQDVRWKIIASATIYNVVLKNLSTVSDREISAFGADFTGEFSSNVTALIEHGPEMFNRLVSYGMQDVRKFLRELNLVNPFEGFAICLNNLSVGLFCEESVSTVYQSANALLRAA